MTGAPTGRRRRARPPQLERSDIIDTALVLVDADGLDALTMRALATRLGVYPTALYWHVGSKAQLLAAVSALVLERIELPPDHDTTWDRWLVDVAHLCRNAMHRHPNLAPVIGSQLVVSTTALPFVERILRVLEQLGLDSEDLLHVYNTVIGCVLGWITLELSRPPEDEEDGWQDGYADELQAVHGTAYPMLTRHHKLMANNAFLTRWQSGEERPMDASFAAAIEVLVAGVRARYLS